MRSAWAIAALLISLLAGAWIAATPPAFSPASDEDAALRCSLPLISQLPAVLLAFGVPVLVAIAGFGWRGWRSASGLAAAARAAIGVGLIGMLVFLSEAFWICQAPAPSPADLARSLEGLFLQPLWCVAAGALLFESLHVRAARREGIPADPVFGDGLLLAMVPLAAIGVFLCMARF